MSYKFDWEDAFLERAHLGTTCTAVALSMMHFASADGQDVYPSIGRLCKILGRGDKPASRHTVVDWLQVLVDEKWLVVVRQGGPKTGTTKYRLNIPGGAGDALPPSAGDAPASAGDAPLVVQEMHQGGAGDAPNQTRDQTISNRPLNRAGSAAQPPRAVRASRRSERSWKSHQEKVAPSAGVSHASLSRSAQHHDMSWVMAEDPEPAYLSSTEEWM